MNTQTTNKQNTWIQSSIRSVCLFGFLIAWVLCAKPAAADSISGDSWMNMSTPANDLPAGELDQWFFDPGEGPPTPPDPSQPWTSASNIATMNEWLTLVVAAGDDPVLLAELNGLGMIDPVSIPVSSSETGLTSVAEPVTSGLLGFGLVLFALYAAELARRMRATQGMVSKDIHFEDIREKPWAAMKV